jgi:hypothetical protein
LVALVNGDSSRISFWVSGSRGVRTNAEVTKGTTKGWNVLKIVDSMDALKPDEYALLRFKPTILGICESPHFYYAGVRGNLFACRGSRVIGDDIEFWEPWFVTPYESLTNDVLEQAMLEEIYGDSCWRWLTEAEVISERNRRSEYLGRVKSYESRMIGRSRFAQPKAEGQS